MCRTQLPLTNCTSHLRPDFCFCLHFSLPTWRTSFNSSYSATLLLWKSFSFCSVSEKYFTFCFENSYAGYRILGWEFWLLPVLLRCLSPCLFADIVSAEKSVIILIFVCLCLMCLFFVWLLKIFSLSFF